MTEYSAEPRLITLTYVLKHTGRTARGGGARSNVDGGGERCVQETDARRAIGRQEMKMRKMAGESEVRKIGLTERLIGREE